MLLLLADYYSHSRCQLAKLVAHEISLVTGTTQSGTPTGSVEEPDDVYFRFGGAAIAKMLKHRYSYLTQTKMECNSNWNCYVCVREESEEGLCVRERWRGGVRRHACERGVMCVRRHVWEGVRRHAFWLPLHTHMPSDPLSHACVWEREGVRRHAFWLPLFTHTHAFWFPLTHTHVAVTGRKYSAFN